MASFDIAVDKVLAHEGGYEAPSTYDPGGETNYGISKRTFPDLDIKNLSRSMAIEIYKSNYWIKDWESLPNQSMANVLLDTSANMGVRAALSIQRVCDGFNDPVAWLLRFTRVRLHMYSRMEGWHTYARGWITRALDW